MDVANHVKLLGKINVSLKTHDKNRVTNKDLELAKIMDESFEREQ